MASYFEDATLWRLRTNLYGIPYKLLSESGMFEFVKASANARVLIRQSDLIQFCTEMLPPPIRWGGITIPQYARFGPSQLCINKINWKSFDDSLPTDPLLVDTTADVGTYYPILELDIELTTTPYGSRDPTDPLTFLEISAESSMQVLYSPPKNATWQNVGEDGEADGEPEANRDPAISHQVMLPQTMWSVGWHKIPLFDFRDIIRPRLESILGKVNSEPFGILYATGPTTLLCVGYSYKYEYSWKDGYVDMPLVDLDIKFLEKNIRKPVYLVPQDVDINGKPGPNNTVIFQKIFGHQDFWRPGHGWGRLLIDGKPTFDAIDFNLLFEPDPNAPPQPPL